MCLADVLSNLPIFFRLLLLLILLVLLLLLVLSPLLDRDPLPAGLLLVRGLEEEKNVDLVGHHTLLGLVGYFGKKNIRLAT